ncbi:MAG TPA: hypothetical protein VIH17_02700 [Candidatus Acidoferrales bacterium]
MTHFDYLIFTFGFVLEVLILWRGLRTRLWRHYPFFYVYLGYVFIRSLILFALAHLQFSGYAITYWLSDAAAVLLWFFVTWEVFRQTFSSPLAVRRVVGQLLLILLVGLTVALFFGSKSAGLFFADLERKAGFVQAALLMATLLLARYYGLPLGRNTWGMALGLGMYVSVAIVNFASLELVKSFFPYWRLIRPLSFIGMLGVWAWALWSYAPNPKSATVALEVSERSLVHWSQAWSEVRAVLRKAVGL